MTATNLNNTSTVTIPDALPVLPIGDTVVFPLAIAPIAVGQERSIKLVDDVMRGNRIIAMVAQHNREVRPARPEDLYTVGTATIIRQFQRRPDGTIRLIVQGLERVQLTDFLQTEPYLLARINPLPERLDPGTETEALMRTLRGVFQQLVRLSPQLPDELVTIAENLTDERQMVYLAAANVPLESSDRQSILEMEAIADQLRRLIELLQQGLAVRELEFEIVSETREELSKRQRQVILREQLRTIQRELGEEDPEQAQLQELRQHFEQANLPAEARAEAERELGRLERLSAASPEHGIIRTYLDWLLSLPWNKTTGGTIDILYAQEVLNEDHYDLERIKDRILEYLAVKKLREERQAEISLTGAGEAEHAAIAGPVPQTNADEARREPILCFVGPPGVGKTSLGQSIARAMGRKFIRISLGGVHDEAEIRGHRRTYIGALPGRIIQALRRADAADAVFMLDEVDKLGIGFQGDPSAALLEVLDPAQNYTFVDTYLGVPFDLSRILFICTANTTDSIPEALLDRMEVVSLAGYTNAEKLHISRRYLLPKQIRAHGLRADEVTMDDEALGRIIRQYTREAGVRNLEREIAAVIRKIARRISEGATTPIYVNAEQIPEYLRRPRFINEVVERIDRPGIATGLAWTPVGGDVLFVEAAMIPGNEERLVITGMLGDVMRESVQAALSYLRSNAEQLQIDDAVFQGKTVHVHVPAGAIPKDGPSAGVTMLTALASLTTGRVVRNDVAMTGEITLRGKVLPVGGIKEKVLAAYQAGVKTVILPRRNEADLDDVPLEVRQQLRFILADSAQEVLNEALSQQPEAVSV
ncbi:endopeptidase La [Nostoc sp. T09]|uniref:endopeptidase La n=1 Tax=Nostoc sp. T09 TaxID=1932621 RepID=UPI000A35F795|nr:endopeptidase La [Nostoc sp. T09]OUL17888.1 endopeptidase La [Nostoc sp. T09]